MLILSIRTDKPEAELYLSADGRQVASLLWQAHRQLAETIHQKIREMLAAQALHLDDVQGIAVYQGPGSFTGLRIGISIVNALAAANKIPIVGSTGEDWRDTACQRLLNGEDAQQVLPEYGAAPHITQPKH